MHLNLTASTLAPRAAAREGLPLWAAVPAAAVGGLALTLALPPGGWWPLVLVSVTLALITLFGRSVGGALLVGGAYGGALFFTHLGWVGEFLGPLPWIALAGLETLLFALGAVPIALAYRWTARLSSRRTGHLLGVPLLLGGLWAAREIVLGAWPYSGFPWVRVGMAVVDSPMAQIASWTGVTGLSALLVTTCAAVVQWARAGGLRFLRGALPSVGFLILLLVVPQFPTSPAGTFDVGWVQGNGPAAYFDTRDRNAVLDAQTQATHPLLGQPMDLLVWPEGGVDSDPLTDADTTAALDSIVRDAGAPLLMNAATTRGVNVFNTSLLWTAGPGEPQRHDKVNPVPFGEYVPDRWLYEKIVPDLVGLIQREYTAGTNPPLVTVGDVGIGLAICFDVIYDGVIWDGVREGAQMYVFQTNNADFRGTAEDLQQLAFARMRAIETGRAVVNVSTTGTSQVIAPDGETTATVAADTVGAAITTIPLRTGLTPAIILGSWISALVPLGAIGTLTALGILHRTRNRPTV